MVRAFVLCYFNYCPLHAQVWHFCGTVVSVFTEFGTRGVSSTKSSFIMIFTSTCTEILQFSGMSYLYHQRIRPLASEVYKLYNEQGPNYLHRLITIKGYTIGRNEKAIELPLCKTKRYGLNSLRYQGAKLWNSIGNNFKGALTLDD